MRKTVLTILYATETGNAAAIAEMAAVEAGRLGVPHRVADAAAYNTLQLPKERLLLLITSTHLGLPPDSASDFFDDVEKGGAALRDLRFAVLAIGDSAYDDFCAAGRRIELAFRRREARPIMPLHESDAGGQRLAREWINSLLHRCSMVWEASPSHDGKTGAAL